MATTMESAPAHKSVPLLEVTETADFKEYAQRSRHAVGARDDQDILIACCWDEFPDSLFYNPAYNMFMPRVKELVSIVAASRNCRERGLAVEEALNKLISVEKGNLASKKPPSIGGWCACWQSEEMIKSFCLVWLK